MQLYYAKNAISYPRKRGTGRKYGSVWHQVDIRIHEQGPSYGHNLIILNYWEVLELPKRYSDSGIAIKHDRKIPNMGINVNVRKM